jgi:lysophospholipase L1-like esterase
MPGSIPSGSVLLADASQASTIKLGGVNAIDGGLCDTAGTTTQATAIDQPTYDTLALNGPCVFMGNAGAPNYAASWLTQTIALGNPFTVVLVVAVDGAAVIFEASSGIATSQGVILYSNNAQAVKLRGGSGYETADALGPPWESDNIPRQVFLTGDGTMPFEASIREAGLSLATTDAFVAMQIAGVAPGAVAGTVPVTIGVDHAGANGTSIYFGFMGIWARRFGYVDSANLRLYLRSIWAPPTLGQTAIYNFESVGDSISLGTTITGSAPPGFIYAFSEVAVGFLGSRFGQVHNFGVGGEPLVNLSSPGTGDVLGQWNNSGNGALSNTLKNIVSVEGGINDFQAGDTGTQVGQNMVTVVTQVVSDMNGKPNGPHLILVSTVVFGVGFSSAAIAAANAYIQANVPGLATVNVHIRIVPSGSDPVLGNISRAGANVYFNDTLHPSKPGQRRWAALMAQQLTAEGL